MYNRRIESDDPRLRRAVQLTKEVNRLAAQQGKAAAERRALVRALLADGWSYGQLATALGVTRTAIQKLGK